jgi:hypothetical protein
MRRWPLIAITVAWLLAGVTIFLSGKWVGETNRYSGCDLITMNARAAYLCPLGDSVPSLPPPKTGDV